MIPVVKIVLMSSFIELLQLKHNLLERGIFSRAGRKELCTVKAVIQYKCARSENTVVFCEHDWMRPKRCVYGCFSVSIGGGDCSAGPILSSIP